MPNVGLDDDSSSSKSEGSPEEDIGCVGDGETSSVQGGMESPTLHGDATNAQRSPRHQTFTNGERRRRKLPEIPKNKRCEYYTPFSIYHIISSTCLFSLLLQCLRGLCLF